MQDLRIHNCGPGDYDAVVRIYNHYVEHSPATFDVAPFTVGQRAPWFAGFSQSGPYQLLVAESDAGVVGFCYSTQYKDRPGYSVSVETTVYVAPDVLGNGVGSALYEALFERLENSSLHGAYANITLPNDASVKLHRKFGFHEIGVETEVGFKFDQYWSVARFERRL